MPEFKCADVLNFNMASSSSCLFIPPIVYYKNNTRKFNTARDWYSSWDKESVQSWDHSNSFISMKCFINCKWFKITKPLFFYLYRKKYNLMGKLKYITFSLSETFVLTVYFPLPLALQGRPFPILNPHHCHCFAGRPHKANMPKLWPSKLIINQAAKQLIWWRPLQSSIHYTRAYVGMGGFYNEHGLLQIRKQLFDYQEFWQNETGVATWSPLLTKY